MRILPTMLALALGTVVAVGWVTAQETGRGRSEDGVVPAAAPKAERPPHGFSPSDRRPEGDREGSQSRRPPVRIAPMFRDLTEDEITAIFAFVAENMPWLKPDLEKLRESDPDRFRQTFKHLRFEMGQLQELKERDPEGFRKAIEEKQLRFRVQDLATKARAAPEGKERDALVAELRKVVDRLFDVELATREAQMRQLEQRLESLRGELKQRAASRKDVINARVDDLLKGKREGEGRFGPPSTRPPEKSEKPEKSESK